ncbi:MAG: hypothetical protein IKS03_00510 [Ruminococcus sp.]|nr:hypothetical protein [Ruminococcus sp.]
MKCASCVNLSICSDIKEKFPNECEYYRLRYDRNKKPEKVRKKPKKPTEKKLSINEIVAECKKIGISYGQFQALRREQVK